MVGEEQWRAFCEKREAIAREQERLKATWIQAGSPEAEKIEAKVQTKLLREYNLYDLLKRPELEYADLADLKGEGVADEFVAEQIEIEAKYSGYIDRQQEEIERMRAYENTLIPTDFDFTQVEGLSNEVKQKLANAKPETLARASRISGVTPAAISQLMMYMKKRGLLKKAKSAESLEQAS